jgi:hypothetical protein
MNELTESTVYCPYCGEPLQVLLDPEEIGNTYIEDCQVCCAPILFSVSEDADGDVIATVRREDE